MPSFIKRGAAARAELEADKQAHENRNDDIRRFWLPQGKAAKITFLDGNLDDDGMLDLITYHEHNVFMNGNYRNWFVCLKDEESGPCPICADGDNPYLAAVFTVIDHSEWKSQRSGKTFKDQPRLLVAKGEVIDTLVRQGIKRDGLAGCTFEVYRPDEQRSYSTGSQFDFEGKEDVKKVIEKYGIEPYDYNEVLPYRTREDLAQLGFGHGASPSETASSHTEDEIPF